MTIELTPDQQRAFEELKEFIGHPEPGIFVLKGSAGTGKTTLVKNLTQYLREYFSRQTADEDDAEESNGEKFSLLAANPIHYGKQLRVGMDNLWAEVNLFYGKKGFTVVKTTKTGSTPELAELASQTLYQILYGA